MLQKAITIAVEAHKNQTDRYQAPYIMHVMRVMMRGKTEEEKICGILHDVVEDTEWTFEDLKKEGFTDAMIEALRCLTKGENEPYDDYISRVKTNKLAIAVKLNDLEDNMDVRRLPQMEPNDVDRFNKYLKAYQQLIQLK
ncbi:Rad52/Rad22 family DNA repair protein [Rhodocytophaga aerolata]|uniref:Rad52/Rad22 family DNA repair protein n=1 Tax=Rhodocytophaga aerolata TaxID=455078 RepID=A0ABT8R1J2_9BACT|nr:Rad52/Rad22 family DNA repair protein [Rhodocytophaga aerolata]MDO1445966.1 Rad52/Rad22 family DNA repair protein [Rhodocytophaga aerolata]